MQKTILLCYRPYDIARHVHTYFSASAFKNAAERVHGVVDNSQEVIDGLTCVASKSFVGADMLQTACFL